MSEQHLAIGLGDAIKRLIRVEMMRGAGVSSHPGHTKSEIELIVQALNTQILRLGMDCDTDSPVQGVEALTHSAATSCCRLIRPDALGATRPGSRRPLRG